MSEPEQPLLVSAAEARAADADREAVAERLRIAAGDGRIDLAARIGLASNNTSHISNKAAETAGPGAPTIIVTGHPVFGYIKIKHRRRKR